MFVLLGFYPLMEFRAVDSVTAHWSQSCSDTAQFGSPRLYTSHHLSTPPCKMHPTALTCPAGNLSPWPSGSCSAGANAVVLVLVLVVLLVPVGPAAITRANGYQAGSPLVKGSNHATDKLVNPCVRMWLTSFFIAW